jgi:hypothetical protein
MPARNALLTLLLTAMPLLSGCDRLLDQLGLPDPAMEAAKAQAEGKAMGSACRQSGRAIEDCYVLNPGALKAAIFAGWKEMNDYMMQNNMEIMPPRLPSPNLALPNANATHEAESTDAPAAADEHATGDQSPEEERTSRRRLRR